MTTQSAGLASSAYLAGLSISSSKPPYCRGTSSDRFRSIQIASDWLYGLFLLSSTTSQPYDAAFVWKEWCRTAFGIAPSRVSKADGFRLPGVALPRLRTNEPSSGR